MFFASAWRLTLGALVLGAGCDASTADSLANPGGSGAIPPASGEAIAFDGPSTLKANPSQTVDVGITIGGSEADISVWLEGDYNDASLSANGVTATGGHATVTLRTPSAATTFVLGAKLASGASARLTVSISTNGYGILSIFPVYAKTNRAATSFRASVFVNARCETLSKAAIRDGTPYADGLKSQSIVLKSIPAGTPIAVTSRAGHYGFGCVDIPALAPEVVTSVEVDLLDVPMALDQTHLQVVLDFEPEANDAAAWTTMLDAALTNASGAFYPTGTAESKALLDGMRATIGSTGDQALFDAARSASGWDAKVTTWLGARTPSMHDRAVAWMSGVKASPIGSLVAQLEPGATAGTAMVTVASFGMLDATSAGIASTGTFDWTADAQDDVHLAGSVRLWGTTLITHGADALAQKDVPTTHTVAGAIAAQIDCAGLGAALAGSGTSFGQCNAACTADACKTAIDARWTAATTIANGPAEKTEIKLTASARADVGEYAEPLHFSGAWVGQVTAPTGSFAMKGTASGDKNLLH